MQGRDRDGVPAETFDRLLEWLDRDRGRAGEIYEALRRKLLKFFEWRGVSEAAELTDRTIDRVGRKVEEGGLRQGGEPSSFFYGVAQNILKEHWAELAQRRRVAQELNATTVRGSGPFSPAEDLSLERRLSCLDLCLSRLSPRSRELILGYYRGSKREKIENRKALADRLGIPMNALWIRSHRLRLTLELCIEKCLRGSERVKSIDSNDQ
jgi:DNA-directed RNA polymerase specialized sigma24 family protein